MEQRFGQRAERLIQWNQVAPGLDRGRQNSHTNGFKIGGAQSFCHALHFNAVAAQQPHKGSGTAWIGALGDEEGTRTFSKAHALPANFLKIHKQGLAVFRGCLHGGQARGEVALNALFQRQGFTIPAAVSQANLARHFKGHAHGAVKAGPTIAVAGIEQIENIFTEKREFIGVKSPGYALAEGLLPVPRDRRGDGVVDRLHGGWKVVAAFRGHLMVVGQHLGIPLQVGRRLRTALTLSLPSPVAVEIEKAVVETPSWPTAGILRILGIRRIDPLNDFRHRLDGPLPAIGILCEVHQQHHAVQLF